MHSPSTASESSPRSVSGTNQRPTRTRAIARKNGTDNARRRKLIDTALAPPDVLDWRPVQAALDEVGDGYLLEVFAGSPFIDYAGTQREETAWIPT